MNWVNALLQGILLGGYYSLIAVGLAFMFRIMRVINLAHGTLVVMVSFVAWAMVNQWGINPFMTLIVIIPGMAIVGWILQRGVLDISTRHDLLVPILATFGLAILINNLLFLSFGASPQSLARFIGTLSYSSWVITQGVYAGKLSVIIFVVALVLLGGLSLFLAKTPMGRAIRATSEDRDTVGLVGISARTINAVAAAIAMVTVGIAGLFLGMHGSYTPYTGLTILIFAFEAAIIGGAGSLWGTLVGGMVLGVAQSFGAQVNPQGFLITGNAVFLVIVIGRVMLSKNPLGRIKARLREMA